MLSLRQLTYTRKHIFGYSDCSIYDAIAGVGFIVWGHHLFLSGQSELAGAIFSFITFGVAVPTAIKTCSDCNIVQRFSSLEHRNAIHTRIPLDFHIGGLTGLPLATLATDVHFHDTYFVVAHFHYVMMGGVLFALITAIHHWWPKMTGRMFSEKIMTCICSRISLLQRLLHHSLSWVRKECLALSRIPSSV